MTVQAAPGVVLAVRAGPAFIQNLIRAGEALEGKEAVANHIVIVTHPDPLGRWIGIQGQPGGVGLADCTPYLSDPWTRGNYGQVAAMTAGRPQFATELNTFLASCAASIGVRYDWAGIAEDIAGALHLNDLTEAVNRVYRWGAPHGLMPGEFVCSSLAWWQYANVGWPHPDPAPGQGETCEPADWWSFNDQQLWAGT
jgi:hypothetical protein